LQKEHGGRSIVITLPGRITSRKRWSGKNKQGLERTSACNESIIIFWPLRKFITYNYADSYLFFYLISC